MIFHGTHRIHGFSYEHKFAQIAHNLFFESMSDLCKFVLTFPSACGHPCSSVSSVEKKKIDVAVSQRPHQKPFISDFCFKVTTSSKRFQAYSFPFKNCSKTMDISPCFVHSRSRSFKGSMDVRPSTLRTYVLTP